ncbi:MAG: 4Fe-4S dicluster domain-containing protein [Deltaproteobacteria bacterium]|nr:4Fe-4S dicluster domain-containing protein [Deltaproteobacteria bacterium]
MVIDLDRCTGCEGCVVACRAENNVPTFDSDPKYKGARLAWMSLAWHEPEEPGALPEALPLPCQHCERPPCTKVCPVGATYKDPEGITAQIWDRCIGCRYCMAACPYSRRSFNWTEPRWPGSLVQLLNPDVATRPMGVVEKCTFCHHRIQKVKERARIEGRAPTDEELVHLPACAQACPPRAISFGDLADPESTVSRLSQSPRMFRLLDHLGTRPQVMYLKRDRRS